MLFVSSTGSHDTTGCAVTFPQVMSKGSQARLMLLSSSSPGAKAGFQGCQEVGVGESSTEK